MRCTYRGVVVDVLEKCDSEKEIENLKQENQRLSEFIDNMVEDKTKMFKEIDELEKEVENLKRDIETLLKHEREWMSFKDTLEEERVTLKEDNLRLNQITDAQQMINEQQDIDNSTLKEELRKLLHLHCERCEDPAECSRCGWYLVTKQLLKCEYCNGGMESHAFMCDNCENGYIKSIK
jgi:seryl-tRNA synthetase